MSISQARVVKPRGPHHCATCSDSVQARNTSARGASIRRETVSSRAADLVALGLTVMLLPSGFEVGQGLFGQGLFGKKGAQAIQALFPELAVRFQPVGGILKWRRFQSAGPPLGLTPARDQA